MGTVEYVIKNSIGEPYLCVFYFTSAKELSDLIDRDTLLNVEEMAAVVVDDLDEMDKIDMALLTYAELIELHRNAGTQIRNTFGLWVENNPNVEFHPDDTSMIVMALVWKILRGEMDTNGSEVMTF